MSSPDIDAPGPLVPISSLVPTRDSAGEGPMPRRKRGKWGRVATVIYVLGTLASMAAWGWVGVAPAIASGLIWQRWPHMVNWWRLRPASQHTVVQIQLADKGAFQAVIASEEQQFYTARDDQAALYALHDLGYWEMRAGNLERALAVLSEVHRRVEGRGRYPDLLRSNLCNNIATAYAAMGAISAATAWVDWDDLTKISAGPCVVAARSRDFERLRAVSPLLSGSADAMLGHSKRVFHLMQLFGRFVTSPDEQFSGQEIAAAKPLSDAEYDYLLGSWRELAEFARLHIGGPAQSAIQLPRAIVVDYEV